MDPRQPRRAEPGFGQPVAPGHRQRLHRDGDAALAKAGEIGGVGHFRALDPPAPLALIGQRHFLDGGERGGGGLVAVGHKGHLEAVDRRAADRVLELDVAEAQLDLRALGRRIGVGRLERGGAGFQRAIQHDLHAVQPQPVVVEPRRRPGSADQRHRLGARRIGHDPQRQRAEIAGPAIGLPVLDRRAHIGDGGDAAFEHDLLRLDQRHVAVLGPGPRAGAGGGDAREAELHQLDMRIDQPGHQHPALAVELVIDFQRPFVAALEQLRDAAVVVGEHGGEALDLTLGI